MKIRTLAFGCTITVSSWVVTLVSAHWWQSMLDKNKEALYIVGFLITMCSLVGAIILTCALLSDVLP